MFCGGRGGVWHQHQHDGGRGDGEHWCPCDGSLLWLQSGHCSAEDDLDINVIFPSDHLLPLGTSWQQGEYCVWWCVNNCTLMTKTSLSQCNPHGCQGKPVQEKWGLLFSLSSCSFSDLSWPHTTLFHSRRPPDPGFDLGRRENGINWISSPAGNRIFPPRPFSRLCPDPPSPVWQ